MLRLWICNRKVNHLPPGEIWCKQFLPLPPPPRVFLDSLQWPGGWQVSDDGLSQPSPQPISPSWLSSGSQGSMHHQHCYCVKTFWLKTELLNGIESFNSALQANINWCWCLSVWSGPCPHCSCSLVSGQVPCHLILLQNGKQNTDARYFSADFTLKAQPQPSCDLQKSSPASSVAWPGVLSPRLRVCHHLLTSSGYVQPLVFL